MQVYKTLWQDSHSMCLYVHTYNVMCLPYICFTLQVAARYAITQTVTSRILLASAVMGKCIHAYYITYPGNKCHNESKIHVLCPVMYCLWCNVLFEMSDSTKLRLICRSSGWYHVQLWENSSVQGTGNTSHKAIVYIVLSHNNIIFSTYYMSLNRCLQEEYLPSIQWLRFCLLVSGKWVCTSSVWQSYRVISTAVWWLQFLRALPSSLKRGQFHNTQIHVLKSKYHILHA